MGCVQTKQVTQANLKYKKSKNYTTFSDQFQGKVFLITGVTGFYGKVIVEKLLRSYSNLGKIYVLVRDKQGMTAQQNLEKNLLNSKLLSNLPQEQLDKIQLIKGDIQQDKLGLSIKDIEFIQKNVNYIIHSAASTDFQAPLKQNVTANVKSTLDLYDIAKKCKNLAHFIYVSSTYSGANQTGLIKEQIHSFTDKADPEEIYQKIINMNQDNKEEEKTIVGDFPNSYCYSKYLCEQLLYKYHELDQNKNHLTLTVFRPSILIGLIKDPIPGWIDQVIAAGVIHYYVGQGLLKYLFIDVNQIIDFIPCDVSVHQLILVLGFYANSNGFNVINGGTSQENPLINGLHLDICHKFFTKYAPVKQVSKPNCQTIFDYNVVQENIQNLLNKNMKVNDENLRKKNELGIEKLKIINQVYQKINDHEMVFESQKIPIIFSKISQEDREKLELADVLKINWVEAISAFDYGISKFILKENIESSIIKEFMEEYVDIQSKQC